MITILVSAAIAVSPSTFYSGLEPKPIPANVFYSGLPEEPKQEVVEPKNEVEENEDETKPDDPLRVIVYVDLADHDALRKLLAECDRFPGLKIEYQDAGRVPREGQSFKLPLVHYYTNTGWKFLSWDSAESFRMDWIKGNTDANGKLPAPALKLNPVRPGNSAATYVANSYEWHLTSGESAQALRSHLSHPRSEHHGVSFDRAFLNRLSFVELIGLHSDAHNGRVRWQYINAKAATQAPKSIEVAAVDNRATVQLYSQSRNESRRERRSRQRWTFRSSGGCPGGNCPR